MEEVSDEVRERVRRLFEFLKRFEERRSPVRRDIEDVEWRIYFSELPQHPTIKTGQGTTIDETASSANLVLSVKKPSLTDCPLPPPVVDGWLLDGWKDPDSEPQVASERTHANNSTEAFLDSPARVNAYSDWRSKRAAWIEAERPARAALAVFNRALALWARLQRDGESARLLLGDGHLLWKRDDGRGIVRHPLLLQEVELRFDEKKRELVFVETDSAPFLYAELLSTFDELDGERRKVCRAIVEKAADEGTCSPLGGTEVNEVLRALGGLLSASDTILPPEAEEQLGTTARLQRDPVLFLAPRAAGFRGAYEAFLQRLPALTSLPVGLSLAVKPPEPTRPTSAGGEILRTSDQPIDLFFTKPSNEAQERIARRLSATGAVLVQGPPGTGKTHTIANLIGHLLAEGKSVLVTAQTSKALRVLREKVVDELKPLCVSVLDSDMESRAELEHAVNGIVSKLASDPIVFERDAGIARRDRENLLAHLLEKEKCLRKAVRAEILDIVVDGRATHPSDAARKVAEGVKLNDWLPGPVQAGAPLPLSETEVSRLYRLSSDLSDEDEQQVREGLPSVEALISPEDFRAVVDALSRPLPSRAGEGERWEFSEGSCPADRLERLSRQVREAIKWLESQQEWVRACIDSLLSSGAHQAPWDAISASLESWTAEIARLNQELLDFEITINTAMDPEEGLRAADEIVAHLGKGGGLGWFSRIGKSSWARVLDETTVNGRPPTVARDVGAIRKTLRIEVIRRQLRRRWERVLAPAGLPLEEDHATKPEVAGRALLPEIRRAIKWVREDWPAFVSDMKASRVPWDRLVEATSATPPHAEVTRVLKCVQNTVLPAVELELEKQQRAKLKAALQTSTEAAAAFRRTKAAREALAAIESLDPKQYKGAFEELLRLHALSELAKQRGDLLRKLEHAAPAWADAIRARLAPHQGSGLPGPVRDAWEHRQYQQELDLRMALDADELQRELAILKEQIQRVTCSLVENLAWSAQARRTNAEHHRALMSWLDLVRRVGKGTGRRADEYRRSARKQLEVARSAVPVWIMPLSRVAESFVPGEKLFDVVILDEASQCDVGALVAFALGRRVVVVGDDEQVSPLDIGQKVEEVRALQEEWLDGFADKDLFDGRASAYEIARRSFPGGLIRLVEHFRCVPDIIAFSNSLSYKGEIRPLRESSSAKVLPPVLAHRVAEGERAATAKVNRAEALEVASLVVAATEISNYAGAELGVISLLGDEQAREIDSLLRRFLDPVEYKKRRVICGTAGHFQGDERDVIFLSMVDSPSDGPQRMVDRDEMRKRYNVAASRARDQLWVVHSLDCERDLKAGDLRRRLLEHALNPAGWRRRSDVEGKVESEFERQVLRALVERDYRVRSQVEVGAYRLDLVVEGQKRRIAVECDGDRFHSLENLDKDLERQAVLEKLGWSFIRIRGSAFFRDARREMERVFKRLDDFGIEHLGDETTPDGMAIGAELRDRVVRRAAECRRSWLEESGSLEDLFSRVSPTKGTRWGARAQGSHEVVITNGARPPVNPTVSTESSDPRDQGAEELRQRKDEVERRDDNVRAGPSGRREARVVGTNGPRSQAPRSATDLFSQTIVSLLTPAAFSCPACNGKRKLWIGRRAPFLKCEAPNCGKAEVVSLKILREALVQAQVKCDCSAPVRLVRVGTSDPFVGCSDYPTCRKTYQWPEIRERLRQRLS